MRILEASRSLARTLKQYRFALAAFLIPFTIRAIPEIIAGPYPIGYDTINSYVPFMHDWAGGLPVAQFGPATGGWLLYAIFGTVFFLTRIDPVTIVKVAGPLLYGILGSAEYCFVRRTLDWRSSKSFLLVLIASIYFVSLRLSLDLFRNTFALGLMLFAFAISADLRSSRMVVLFSFITALAGLTHTLVAVILVSTVLLQSFFEKGDPKKLLGLVPATAICLESVVGFASVGVPTIVAGSGTGQALPLYAYSVYMFLPLIPMAALGVRGRKSRLVSAWLLVCILGAVLANTPLAISGQLVPPDRWSLMMFLPLTIFSVEGLMRLNSSISRLRSPRGTIAVGWTIMIIILSVGYVGLQAESSMPYFSYFTPTSMLQSSVPLHDSQDVVSSLQWLSENVQNDSVVVTPNPIYGWAREYFTGHSRILEFYSGTSLKTAIQTTAQQGFLRIYTVWWANGQGWYGDPTVPDGLTLIHQSGSFGVYLYEAR